MSSFPFTVSFPFLLRIRPHLTQLPHQPKAYIGDFHLGQIRTQKWGQLYVEAVIPGSRRGADGRLARLLSDAAPHIDNAIGIKRSRARILRSRIQMPQPLQKMAPLSSFAPFSRLPTEIRFQIWDRVPQPQRMIGLAPCPDCLGESAPRCRRSHPAWTHFYFVQPRDQAINPLLHACRESRALLLPRYDRPPREMAEHLVRFEVPFIDYERDIFTIYEEHLLDQPRDPFAGLDRSRIRHIGFSEIPREFIQSLIAMDGQKLTQVKTLSLVVCGPYPPAQQTSGLPLWVQPRQADLPFYDCRVLDLSPELIRRHPFFSELRPRHPMITLEPRLQGVSGYMVFFTAWLWHAFNRDLTGDFRFSGDDDPWWAFTDYVAGEGGGDDDDAPCPLGSLEGCGDEGGHGRREMLLWDPPFEIGCKMICEEGWFERLSGARAFEVDVEGRYEPFMEFLSTQVFGRKIARRTAV